MRERYTEDEANRILQRAIERQTGHGGMSHEQLGKLAGEIGISSEELERAEVECLAGDHERGLWNAYSRERRRRWLTGLLTYFAVCSFLLFINHAVTPGFLWATFPILGWGLAIVLDAIKVLLPPRAADDAEYCRWLDKNTRRPIEAGESGPPPYAQP